jgi:hypothetical protein
MQLKRRKISKGYYKEQYKVLGWRICNYDLEITCPAQFLPSTEEPHFITLMSSSFNDFGCVSIVHSIQDLQASQGPEKMRGKTTAVTKMWNPRCLNFWW